LEKKIPEINKNTFRHRWLSIAKNFKFLPDEQFVKILYECYTTKKLDLENPITFNQKLQWYKLYHKNPLFTTLVDKYRVRDWVKEKIGEQYLNTLLGHYTHPDEIDYESLPNQFVLKGVHGSSMHIIVKDKATFDTKSARKVMLGWQAKDYFIKSREWPYKNVPRDIIAEAYMEEPGRDVLNDYKIFCFDGEPHFTQVDLERGIEDYRCFYDNNWKKLPFFTVKNVKYQGDVPQPEKLEEMLDIARTLSAGIPFVRVDLYAINGKTIFGEMTFFPTGGLKLFTPLEWNTTIGDYFTLPEKIV